MWGQLIVVPYFSTKTKTKINCCSIGKCFSKQLAPMFSKRENRLVSKLDVLI